MRNRPIIKIKSKPIDKALEFISILLLILIWIIPIMYFNTLPESIPIHFGIDAIADGYGSRQMIWGIPVISTMMYLFLYYINRNPHKLNYLSEVTIENAPRLYQSQTRLISVLKVVTLIIFLIIVCNQVS